MRRSTQPVRRRIWIAGAAAATIMSAVVAGEALRRASKAPSPVAASAERPGPARIAPGPTLAVLPFENVGPADDAYFAQGVSDALTSRLTSVAGARVISANSAREYRNTTKTRTEIGRELGVDYLLAGSVRWDQPDEAAHRVRVTVELVRSRDGSAVWADRYEATTDDLFAMEGAIGEKVANALQIALAEPERRAISARPTQNFEAYTYFLRGEALRIPPEDALTASPGAVAMYERAVALDPTFALAFARLAETHGSIYWASTDRTAKRLAFMREAAETAVRLDPDLPEARLALGLYYYRARRDYDRALSEFSSALRHRPGESELLMARGFVLRRQGRFADAVADLSRAVELDPRSARTAFNLGHCYAMMRAHADAARYFERAIALSAQWASVYADLATQVVTLRGGDVAAARRALRDGMALPDASALVARLRFQAPMLVGFSAPDSAVLRELTASAFRGDTAEYLVVRADWLQRNGESSRARAYADSARVILERRVGAEPGEPGPRMLLALAYARLARRADALREGRRAVDLLPPSRDAVDGPDLQEDLAYVEMLVGEHDAAVRRLASLLAIPSDVTVPLLRVDPMWDPLRSNPGFQRLVATPVS